MVSVVGLLHFWVSVLVPAHGGNRQDTWSDLQLFGVVNLIVILAFGWLKTNLVDAVEGLSREDLAHKPFWSSIYEARSPCSCPP
jgi:hypothetical protein